MTNNTRRKMTAAISLLPFLISCKAVDAGPAKLPMTVAQQRLNGIGLILVTDAVLGAEMLGVEFFADGSERPFYAKSRLTRRNREIMSYPGRIAPESVRVVWRKRDESYYDAAGLIRYGGDVAGDYTILVARRIPDDVIDDIRKHGGGLRLKFRLKKDGVMFGWDIERDGGGISRFDMPGGDFLETKY